MKNLNQTPTPERVNYIKLPCEQFSKLVKSAHRIIDLSGLRTEIYPADIKTESEGILIPDLVSTAEPISIVPALVGEEWYDNIKPLFTPEGIELPIKG